MTKDALRALHGKGVISSSSWVWASGMAAPQQLGRVRELRWMLSSGLGLLGPFDAALVALQVRGKGWRGGCCCFWGEGVRLGLFDAALVVLQMG